MTEVQPVSRAGAREERESSGSSEPSEAGPTPDQAAKAEKLPEAPKPHGGRPTVYRGPRGADPRPARRRRALADHLPDGGDARRVHSAGLGDHPPPTHSLHGTRGPERSASPRSKVRIAARQWSLAKALPHTYGDKLEHGGSIKVEQVPQLRRPPQEVLDQMLARYEDAAHRHETPEQREVRKADEARKAEELRQRPEVQELRELYVSLGEDEAEAEQKAKGDRGMHAAPPLKGVPALPQEDR